MKHGTLIILIIAVIFIGVIPVWSEDNMEEKEIGTDDYIMFGAGAIAGAGLQELFYRDKPVAESRVPSIVMGYFMWNAVVIFKEIELDNGHDRMSIEDIAIANAGYTLGTLIWHYTVGKSVKIKPKKPRGRYRNYLKIGDKPTQIKLL